MNSQKSLWYIYILKCSDDSLYTGITTDLNRRVEEHNNSLKGAKYTRSRRPVELVYFESCRDKSSATSRELGIKKLTRAKKLELIR
ncbi:GIY-YIG nuclease family protein [Sulfurimonas sp.]|uniref:GIY-YIG nuclease family protein n=1 Tax=Sulfurimonas sp. TaxID=2022749 RepID=UPI0025D4BE49|nr:GIY-YIG nuclease family protein [Sulfurimonas sp.]MCK9473698.1 GIY-YIG nuclease family protein [Sulfurimonas sp.]